MKQYIVDRHTTPNTPKLEQVPTEKIPVYDDLDAAAADLANLADGQIGATADSGSELSAPTDTVQSGNMHAVTSNAVAESLSVGAFEDLSMPQNVEVTIQKDGVLFISAPRGIVSNTGRELKITLNGFNFEYYLNANLDNNWGATAIIPVFAGDIIKVISTQNIVAKIRYYNR